MHSVLRMQRLSRLSEALSELENELDLERLVTSALAQVFAPASATELYLMGETSLHRGHVACSMSSVLARLRGRPFDDEARAEAVLRAPHLFGREPDQSRGCVMSMPIILRGELMGVIVVERPIDALDLTFADLEILSGVAGQIGFALIGLRRSQSTRRRMRIAEDLRQAREVQRKLLPTLPPSVGPLRVAAAYRPAFEVGGDFYDLVEGPSGETVVVIGDVSGTGVAAALIMSRISSEFRRLAHEGTPPAEILAELDRSLRSTALESGFVTAAVLLLDVSGCELRFASAGHLPLLVRRADREVDLFGRKSGVPLGVLEGQTWVEERIALAPGDLMLLTTDGALEAIDPEAGMKGLLRLGKLLRESTPDVDTVAAHVLEAVVRAEGRADDVTVLALQVVSPGSDLDA
jgi:serine phosphatase RsbU (regulator of sigma subunit)